jgi:hypothetical protein
MKPDRESALSVRVLPGVNFTDVGVVIVTLDWWAKLRAWGPEYCHLGGKWVRLGAGALTHTGVARE